ncbi:MAG: hypothetical protein QM607_03140 [Microbacterium sp.]
MIEQRGRVADTEQKQQELAALHAQENRTLITQAFGDRASSSPGSSPPSGGLKRRRLAMTSPSSSPCA